MTLRAPFGSWPSPITAEHVAAGTVPVGGGQFVGDELWWLEGRPAEGGRLSVVARPTHPTADAADTTDAAEPRELVPAPFNVRSRVNEYGGAAWAPIERDGRHELVFVNFADQRVHLLDPAGSRPVPLTPGAAIGDGADAEPVLRFAEFTASALPGEVLAQCEDHRGEEIERYIVAIPLDGSAADDAGALRRVTPASRFVAGARVSPDGRHIAWICWEHPQMPWDGTELRVADLDASGTATGVRTLAGAADESVLQPEWLDAGTLAYISDRTGWWNLYAQAADGSETVRALCPREEEFAGPLWQLGTTWFSVLDAGKLLAAHGTDGMRLGLLDTATGELEDLDLPFTHALPAAVRRTKQASSASTAHAATSDPESASAGGAAGGAPRGRKPRPAVELLVNGTTLADGSGLRLVDLVSGSCEDVRLSMPDLPDAGALPAVRSLEFTNPDGGPVHAHIYGPRLGIRAVERPDADREEYAGQEGELPPFVAFIHGGPTSQAHAGLSLGIAYYTSRGLGVVDINYGGSTGYGRAYRERLKGQWGVVDVADTVAVMDGLVAAGIADGDRLAIEGGSAGGWTALACLTRTDRFTAGVSRYGVADLEALVADTHDFESRYMEGLVGPWPQARELYRDRAPVNHVDGLDCPVLLLQGDEDKVVPPNQSRVFADALAAKGIPHAYVLFAGEQHGFRRAENIVRAHELTLAFYARVFGFTTDVPAITLVGDDADLTG